MFLISIGVLHRHESLAGNLGAKLVGPLLLKSFEKLFDGPIKVLQNSNVIDQSPVTWLDIVTFARSTPADFFLSDLSHGTKACRIWIKSGQIEISEDDYRIIMSGAPERLIPTQPIDEDEAAELGTLNILETRLAMLIRKADSVAGKARQLNYHLKTRKTELMARKSAGQPVTTASEEQLKFPRQHLPFINGRSPAPIDDEAAKLQQELLEQFLSSSRPPSVVAQARPKGSHLPNSESPSIQHTFTNAHQDADGRRVSPSITPSNSGTDSQYRILMAAKIEKMARGDLIYPPCDRCRRLNFECAKHLTSCSACTKKHAKCSWKDVKEGELDRMPLHTPAQTGENGYMSSTAGVQGILDPGLRVAADERRERESTQMSSLSMTQES